MKITRIGSSFPLLTAATLGSGGSITGAVGSGLVPVSNGSNSWAWGSNVQTIQGNGVNALGPIVNFADGSNTTVSVSSNTIRIHATPGAASFGSNSNAVSSANAPGASTDSSRADHVHLGVTSLAHSSNTFSGPVILTASGVLGITSPTPGTYNLSSTGGSGGGGSTVTTKDEGSTLSTAVTTLDFVGAGVTASGAGATTTVTIPGGGGGGLTLLETQTASASATLDFTTFISSTYDEYIFELMNLIPATDNVDLYMRVGTGGGPTYDAGNNYSMANFRWSNTGSAATGATPAAPVNAWNLSGSGGIDNGANYGVWGSVHLFGPQSGIFKKITGELGYVDNAGAPLAAHLSGQYVQTTVLTAVRFLFSSGNITSGIIRAYGIPK